MRHAGAATLAELEPMLVRLRSIEQLTERKPGIFYWRSTAFLHFHEDPAGIFADVKLDLESWERLPVSSARQRTQLLARVSAMFRKT